MESAGFFKINHFGRIAYTGGFIDPKKAEKIYTMLGHYFSSSSEPKPSVISVGTGLGYHEQQLKELAGLEVVCYDKNTSGYAPFCLFAEFPQDNARVIPADCRHMILFSAYPQGYLGELLKRYKENGGTKLCVVTEGDIHETDMHFNYEPDYHVYDDDARPSCLLESELSALEAMGATHLVIGGEIPFQLCSTNIVFYGDWNHRKLSELLACQPEGVSSRRGCCRLM